MKVSIVFAIALIASSGHAFQKVGKFKVTIQNLTKGQPLTPLTVLTSRKGQGLFEIGKPASKGVALIATDGDNKLLVSELRRNRFRRSSQVFSADKITKPGEKTVLILKASPHQYLSAVSMLAKTNDAIVGINDISLNMRIGVKKKVLLKIYDAGVELNIETCATIPGPPCNSIGYGTDGYEGFVHPHPGVTGIADLDILKDSFGSEGALLTVERIR